MALPILAPIGVSLLTSAIGEVTGKLLNKVGLTGTSKVVDGAAQTASNGLISTAAGSLVNTFKPPAR